MSSYISRIKPNGAEGTEYKLKDEEARSAIQNTNNNVRGRQSASGSIVTITDAAPINAEEVIVDFEPQQDLHGYDKPWVGGAGKNKLNYDDNTTAFSNACTFSITNYVIKVSITGASAYIGAYNASNVSSYFGFSDCVGGQSYKVVVSSDDVTGIYATYYDSNNSKISSANVGRNAFTVPSNAAKVGFQFAFVNSSAGSSVEFTAMLVLSTETDPTFAPYSNICPITGYTDVNVGSVGKNLFDDNATISVYDVNTSGAQRAGYVLPVIAGETYAISAQQGGSDVYIDAEFHDSGTYTYIGRIVSTTTLNTLTFTATKSCDLYIYDAASAQTAVAKPRIQAAKIQLELGNAATPYEPYTSFTTHTPLGRTVYGGKLNVRTGEMVVDRGIIDFANIILTKNDPNNANDYLYYTQGVSGDKNGELSCSHAPVVSSAPTGNTLGVKYTSSGNIYINLTSNAISNNTVEGMRSYCVNNNVTVCYELATPQTYQLTPQELKLLKQYNYITTNGTTISLKYQPNNVIGETKGEVQELKEYVDKISEDNYSRNLFDKDNMDIVSGKFLNGSGQEQSLGNANYSKTFIPVHPNTTYIWTGDKMGGTDINPAIYGYNSNKEFVQRTGLVNTDTFTTNSDVVFIQLQFGGTSPYTVNDFSSWQIEKGIQATAYEPYIPTNAELYEMIKALQQNS